MSTAASRALRCLALRLQQYGLQTRLDPVARTVDATAIGFCTLGPGRRVALRALIRPYGTPPGDRASADSSLENGAAGEWWWLMIPNLAPAAHRGVPEVFALAPLCETRDAARRIWRTLILDRDVTG